MFYKRDYRKGVFEDFKKKTQVAHRRNHTRFHLDKEPDTCIHPPSSHREHSLLQNLRNRYRQEKEPRVHPIAQPDPLQSKQMLSGKMALKEHTPILSS